jgi:hypothetical protein
MAPIPNRLAGQDLGGASRIGCGGDGFLERDVASISALPF